MYVSVKFREGDSRTYTYTCDLERAPEIGEAVLVETKDGTKVVYVAALDQPEPSFPCKPIIGIAPPKEPTEGTEAEAAQ